MCLQKAMLDQKIEFKEIDENHLGSPIEMKKPAADSNNNKKSS